MHPITPDKYVKAQIIAQSMQSHTPEYMKIYIIAESMHPHPTKHGRFRFHRRFHNKTWGRASHPAVVVMHSAESLRIKEDIVEQVRTTHKKTCNGYSFFLPSTTSVCSMFDKHCYLFFLRVSWRRRVLKLTSLWRSAKFEFLKMPTMRNSQHVDF